MSEEQKKRAGTLVTSGNILGECPACFSAVGEVHKEYCDEAYAEFQEARKVYADSLDTIKSRREPAKKTELDRSLDDLARYNMTRPQMLDKIKELSLNVECALARSVELSESNRRLSEEFEKLKAERASLRCEIPEDTVFRLVDEQPYATEDLNRALKEMQESDWPNLPTGTVVDGGASFHEQPSSPLSDESRAVLKRIEDGGGLDKIMRDHLTESLRPAIEKDEREFFTELLNDDGTPRFPKAECSADFATGGTLEVGKTYLVGEQVSDHVIPRELAESINGPNEETLKAVDNIYKYHASVTIPLIEPPVFDPVQQELREAVKQVFKDIYKEMTDEVFRQIRKPMFKEGERVIFKQVPWCKGVDNEVVTIRELQYVLRGGVVAKESELEKIPIAELQE